MIWNSALKLLVNLNTAKLHRPLTNPEIGGGLSSGVGPLIGAQSGQVHRSTGDQMAELVLHAAGDNQTISEMIDH
jgi:hypothetical protein